MKGLRSLNQLARVRRVAWLLALLAPATGVALQVQIQGGGGLGRVGGSLVSAVDAGVHVRHGDLRLQLRAPLRSQLTGDRSDTIGEGTLRARDWDERSELLRLAPHLSWTRATAPGRLTRVSATVAPTAGATLGHGSVVRGYRSALLPDHFASGLRLDVDGELVGLQLLVGDVTRWDVVATRLFARPLAGGRGAGWARHLTVGLTAAADRQAPVATLRGADGAVRVADDGRPVQERAALVVAGLDVGLPIALGRGMHLVPYVDGNVATVAEGGGAGVHGGLWWAWRGRHGQLRVRWEGRGVRGAYRPGWIDGFYALERMQLGGGGPKAAAWLDRQGTSRWGHLVEARLESPIGWRAAAAWETWHAAVARPDDTASLQLSTPERWGLRGHGAWALRPGRGQQVVAVAARWQSEGPWHAWADARRTWHASAGQYDLTWNASVGAGARWQW